MENNIEKHPKKAPKSQLERDKRRKAVLNWMEKVGPFSVPALTLSKEHGVDVTVIYRDRDYWIKRMKFKDIQLIGKKAIMTTEKNLSVGEEIRLNQDPKIKLGAISSINQSAEVVTKLLESYGFKEAAEQRFQVENKGGGIFNLITTPIGQIKDEKNKNRGNKPEDKPEAGTNN